MTNSVDIASLILQIYSLQILIKDFDNSDLMQELQKQDKEYLEKIIEQNNEILTFLRKEDKWKKN